MRAKMLFGLGLCSSASYALLATTTTTTATTPAWPAYATSPWWAGMLFFIAGATFAPSKYLPPTIYTLQNVDPQHSGKVIALMDVPGYLVSSIFFQIYPKIVDAHGWSAVWWLVAGMVAVSTVCITLQQRLEAGTLRKQQIHFSEL